jgi:CRP-like cAMP-binding protein
MTDLKELLTTHLAVEFDDSEVETLAALAHHREYEQGYLLFGEEDPADSVYFVGSGAVDLYTIVEGNLEQTLLSVREGGFIGILALLEDGDTRDINARVSESTELYRFDKESLAQLISDGGPLGLKLLRVAAKIAATRTRIVLASLRQNLEWTLQVSGLAALDISQMIVDQVDIKIEMMNGKHLTGTIMKAEERPHGFEIYIKTGDGTIHFIPYHAIASASFPLGDLGRESKIKGM